MDDAVLSAWFDQYLTTFAALARGDSDDTDELLQYYALPLLVTTNDAAQVLSTAEDVTDFARRQAERLRAVNYDHSTMLGGAVRPLNASTALYETTFARERADGSEIARLGVTYLIAEADEGLRIFVLAVHAAV